MTLPNNWRDWLRAIAGLVALLALAEIARAWLRASERRRYHPTTYAKDSATRRLQRYAAHMTRRRWRSTQSHRRHS
jgi:hypothetical protein